MIRAYILWSQFEMVRQRTNRNATLEYCWPRAVKIGIDDRLPSDKFLQRLADKNLRNTVYGQE